MKDTIADALGCEFPLIGFSHCRDVVAEVTNAGGFGMLGAVRYTPEELDTELTWLDRHVDGRPNGVDILLPARLATSDRGLDASALAAQVPQEHLDFVTGLLHRYGVLDDPRAFRLQPRAVEQYSDANVKGLLDVAFAHPIRLIANALGVAAPGMIARAHAEGVPVAALVGKVEHAAKQVAAGVDVIVAQGHEAGGHAGPITTMVLIPQVADAVAPLPVLAAGGIASGRQMAAAMALGASGVWAGSVWLATEEAETDPVVKQKFLEATSSDAVQSLVRTGKPARQLRTRWHEEWQGTTSPGPLPMPLMEMISFEAFERISRAAEAGNPGARELDSYFVGQVVGMMNKVSPVKTVVYEMIEEYVSTVENMHARLTGDAR